MRRLREVGRRSMKGKDMYLAAGFFCYGMGQGFKEVFAGFAMIGNC